MIERAVSVVPITSGFCFAVLEGSERLLDWGIRRVAPAGYELFSDRLESIISRSQPSLLIVENPFDSNRKTRALDRLDASMKLGRSSGLTLEMVSRDSLLQHLGGGF